MVDTVVTPGVDSGATVEVEIADEAVAGLQAGKVIMLG